MKLNRFRSSPGLALCAIALAAWSEPRAQQPPPEELRWHDAAELSYVVTGGNSKTNTFGFKNKLWRKWDSSAFELNAGGVRAESETTLEIFASGTPNDFFVNETKETSTTAENYYLNGRYDRKITDRLFWFGQAGWDRNRFAGVDNRYVAAGGVGNVWADSERLKFRTDYSITFTRQDDVADNPEVDDSFVGARLSYAYLQKLGGAATFTSDLVLDGNSDETQDFRANMINSVAVSMSARLALKVSLQWLYDNKPSFKELELFAPLAPPPTGPSTGTVLIELDELDTIFTTSLVITL